MAHEADIPDRRGHWISSTPRAVGHEALLTLARKVHAAASDADPSRMQTAARELSEALDRHLQEEARSMMRVDPTEARILKKGQARVATLASELLVDSGQGCASSGPGCEARAQLLLALLSVQAHDEWRAWGSPGGRTVRMEGTERWSRSLPADIPTN